MLGTHTTTPHKQPTHARAHLCRKAANGDSSAALDVLEAVVEESGHPGVRLLTAKLCFEEKRWRDSKRHFKYLASGAMKGNAEVW